MQWGDMIINIVEKLFVLYFSTYLLIDLGLFIGALLFFRKKPKAPQTVDFEQHPVSIIVPAYNEEVSIVDCIQMLLRLNYPNYHVIVVNDGSHDKTLEQMIGAFEWGSEVMIPTPLLRTAPIRSVFQSSDGRLLLIDKENGGKADSINSAINLSQDEFICTIDADSILDRDALRHVVEPLLADKDVFVSGGQLAVSNDLTLIDNKVVSSKMPRNLLILWQIIEYIKSFMVSRLGFSQVGSLLIMSGAFSLYRRDDLLDVGGFLTPVNDHPGIAKTIGIGHRTICEDMEVVVRLKRHFLDLNRPVKTRFLPTPVCWTEVPPNLKSLFRQRARWHTGLAETILMHRVMIFEPKYKFTGLFALPYYMLFELLSPLMKVLALSFLVIISILGLINSSWVALLLISITLMAAIFTSSITALIERWSGLHSGVSREAMRYKGIIDWLLLIGAGILSDFSFAFIRMTAQLKGLSDFVRSKSEWNKFDRRGLYKKT